MSQNMICAQRLYLTADKSELVSEGDQRAATLYATPGDEIPVSAAEKFGLVDGALPGFDAAAAAEAEAAEKAAAEQATKEAFAAQEAAHKAAAEAAAKEAAEKEAAEAADKAKADQAAAEEAAAKEKAAAETKPKAPAKTKGGAK